MRALIKRTACEVLCNNRSRKVIFDHNLSDVYICFEDVTIQNDAEWSFLERNRHNWRRKVLASDSNQAVCGGTVALRKELDTDNQIKKVLYSFE